MIDRLSLVQTSGQEMEQVYSYDPGARTRHVDRHRYWW